MNSENRDSISVAALSIQVVLTFQLPGGYSGRGHLMPYIGDIGDNDRQKRRNPSHHMQRELG
jgi:hypothetical protein